MSTNNFNPENLKPSPVPLEIRLKLTKMLYDEMASQGKSTDADTLAVMLEAQRKATYDPANTEVLLENVRQLVSDK